MDHVQSLLIELQDGLFNAKDRVTASTREVRTEEFAGLEEGGFLSAHWDGTAETEERIKKETKATIRCLPLDGDTAPGACIRTGNPSARRVLFARPTDRSRRTLVLTDCSFHVDTTTPIGLDAQAASHFRPASMSSWPT